MGKLRLSLDLLLPLLMLTSVKVVDSLLDEEAADEVRFPKLAVHTQYLPSEGYLFENHQNAGAELMVLKKSKKSFASFRIRTKSGCICNLFYFFLVINSFGNSDHVDKQLLYLAT